MCFLTSRVKVTNKNRQNEFIDTNDKFHLSWPKVLSKCSVGSSSVAHV